MSNAIVTHGEVMAELNAGPGPVSEIADRLGVSTSTARRYLGDLYERGWVERWGYRRPSQSFGLTPRGRQAHADLERF